MSKTGSCLCGEVNFTYKSEPGMSYVVANAFFELGDVGQWS